MKLAYVLIFSWLITLAATRTTALAAFESTLRSSLKACAALLDAAFSRHVIAAKSLTLIDAFSGGPGDIQVVR